MPNRRKYSKEETKDIGLRIRACRVLTGFTQEEFGTKFKMPVPSIKTWEMGSVIPRIDGLKKYTAALEDCGIFVNTDWLMHGIGTGPSYFLSNAESQSEEHYVDEFTSIKDMFSNICRRNKENPIVIKVEDDEMLPLFKPGDFLAGVLTDKRFFNYDPEKPVLINIPGIGYAPRFIHQVGDEYFISSLKDPAIKRFKMELFGLIKWHILN